MKNIKKSKLFGDFYYTIHKEDKQIKVPYEWDNGEKEEYLKVCGMTEGWGGIPLDVSWAKSTTVYKEAHQKLISEQKDERSVATKMP